MAAVPPNKNNQSKAKPAAPSVASNAAAAPPSKFAWNGNLDDIDEPQYQANTNSKGATMMAAMPRAMGYQESYENFASASGHQFWGPKQFHPNRSIPKDAQSGMGSKGGSYTMEVAPPKAKDGHSMTMPLVPSKLGGGSGFMSKEGMGASLMEHSLLAAKNNDIVVINSDEHKSDKHGKHNPNKGSDDTNDDAGNSNELGAGGAQSNILVSHDEQADNEAESKENDAALANPYRVPLDSHIHTSLTPLVFNPDYCSIDCPASALDADSLKAEVVDNLNGLVETGLIDWSYADKYTFQGRIFKNNEDAGVRVIIYALEEDDNTADCTVLEVRRNGGDSFLFQEFKSKFLTRMSESNAIDYSLPEFTMEHGCLGSDFSELPPLPDSDLSSDMDDLGFLTPLSSMSNMTTLSNDFAFDAKACVDEATSNVQDRYREMYRESVAFLRNAADNDSKLQEIMGQDNIIDKLLTPIYGNNQIFDTLVIKSLLEVIHRIVEKDASLASANNRQAIRDIGAQWEQLVRNPISNNIEPFYPSQQIQWIAKKCIQKF